LTINNNNQALCNAGFLKGINMDKKYIASWSGGKDSTYMVDELLKRGEPLDEVIFCDTGFEHYVKLRSVE
jgi:3'-phosphoadenosine 5'-phosphosulfate sulfotransferase (PAPS reductase)/FAD synthetase